MRRHPPAAVHAAQVLGSLAVALLIVVAVIMVVAARLPAIQDELPELEEQREEDAERQEEEREQRDEDRSRGQSPLCDRAACRMMDGMTTTPVRLTPTEGDAILADNFAPWVRELGLIVAQATMTVDGATDTVAEATTVYAIMAS
jgi:hypothetical protein